MDGEAERVTGRAAVAPLPETFATPLGRPLARVAESASDYLRGSAAALASRRAPPPLDPVAAALAAYAAEHGANRDRWLFLTGEKQVMVDICMKGFKLPLDEEGGTPAEPITHSTRFVLVDKQGEIRGYYAGTEEGEVKRLAADAKKLL